MAVQRMEHVGVVVDDLDEAVAFFTLLGLEVDGRTSVGGEAVDRITGLTGAQADIVMLRTPDGGTQLELTAFRSPPAQGLTGGASNARGIRHILFVVTQIHELVGQLHEHGWELVGELVNYGDSYWLCYVRGPGGIIVELAERVSNSDAPAGA